MRRFLRIGTLRTQLPPKARTESIVLLVLGAFRVVLRVTDWACWNQERLQIASSLLLDSGAAVLSIRPERRSSPTTGMLEPGARPSTHLGNARSTRLEPGAGLRPL